MPFTLSGSGLDAAIRLKKRRVRLPAGAWVGSKTCRIEDVCCDGSTGRALVERTRMRLPAGEAWVGPEECETNPADCCPNQLPGGDPTQFPTSASTPFKGSGSASGGLDNLIVGRRRFFVPGGKLEGEYCVDAPGCCPDDSAGSGVSGASGITTPCCPDPIPATLVLHHLSCAPGAELIGNFAYPLNLTWRYNPMFDIPLTPPNPCGCNPVIPWPPAGPHVPLGWWGDPVQGGAGCENEWYVVSFTCTGQFDTAGNPIFVLSFTAMGWKAVVLNNVCGMLFFTNCYSVLFQASVSACDPFAWSTLGAFPQTIGPNCLPAGLPPCNPEICNLPENAFCDFLVSA